MPILYNENMAFDNQELERQAKLSSKAGDVVVCIHCGHNCTTVAHNQTGHIECNLNALKQACREFFSKNKD
jgi:hypothetical protein